MRSTRRRTASRRGASGLTVAGAVFVVMLAACGDDSGTGTGDAGGSTTVVLLAYDSFVAPDALDTFTEETGIEVEVARGGDAGTLVNKAILTAGNPEGDVLWGLDNTLLSRAVDADVFVPHEAADLGLVDDAITGLVPNHEVTPVDTGDVCINVDSAWFSERGVTPPVALDDLTSPAMRGLTVVPNPATSSPGLAFLFATVAHFGEDGFEDYWASLRDNDVLVVDSWDAAYFGEFTAGGGGGDRPIVVSYASSPPATIVLAEEPRPTEPTTRSLDDTCFRQVEFAGVLRGTEHEDEAKSLVDFLLSESFQSELPLTNFVYPLRQGVELPEVFEQFGRPAPSPLTLDPADIDANRETWIEAWTQTVLG